jgi:hypothetical protein
MINTYARCSLLLDTKALIIYTQLKEPTKELIQPKMKLNNVCLYSTFKNECNHLGSINLFIQVLFLF